MTEEGKSAKLLPAVGFVLCALVVGLFAGAFIGRLSVSKTDGMAGAAIVLYYGLFGGVILVVGAILLVRRLERRGLLRALMIIGPLAVILFAGATWRFMKLKAESDRRWEIDRERYKQLKPTAPTAPVMFASLHTVMGNVPTTDEARDPVLGLGMAAPIMELGTFHFHGAPDLDQLPGLFRATDSLTFAKGEHFIDITSAPPWFVPAHLKLDYGLLLLKVVTLSRNWAEVEVNSIDGTTRWVDRGELHFETWSEFIINVNSVEIIDTETNPVRLKPLDHAAILAEGANALLVPLAVRGDWLMVSTDGLADRIVPTGWIRWRDGERLLVRYNLLC